MNSLAFSSIQFDAQGVRPFTGHLRAGEPPNTADAESIRGQKLRKATQDFEAILLSSWWQSMQESFPGSLDDDGKPAHGMLQEWSIQVMSSTLAAAGGLGIARLLYRHLEPRLTTGQPTIGGGEEGSRP